MKKSFIALAVSLLMIYACSSSPSSSHPPTGDRATLGAEGGQKRSRSSSHFSNGEGEEEQLSILFTGDVLLDRGVRPIAERRGVAYLFDSVRAEFRQSDAVIINLECPLTDTVSPVNKRYIFRANAEWAMDLQKVGITHAALANNHTNDQGRRGLQATYQHLTDAGIIPLGYGSDYEQQSSPVIISKGHVRVAVFNAVMMALENWHYLDGKPGVCQPASDSLVSTIADYHQQHPDTRIVTVLHWGVEFNTFPSINQRFLARQLADAGADAIIGHHPHVVQPIDTIGHSLVCYSLGNFVFDQHPPQTRQCLMVRLNIKTGTSIAMDVIPAKIVGCRPITLSTPSYDEQSW